MNVHKGTSLKGHESQAERHVLKPKTTCIKGPTGHMLKGRRACVEGPKGRPAHALCQAVAVGHRHPLHQLKLCKSLCMLVGHVLVHRQPALHALDLALLHTDLLELVEDILRHAVLQQQIAG